MSKTGYPFEADQRTVFPTAPTLTSYNDPPPSYYSPTPPRQQQPQVIQPPQVAQQPQAIQQPQVAQQPYIVSCYHDKSNYYNNICIILYVNNVIMYA